MKSQESYLTIDIIMTWNIASEGETVIISIVAISHRLVSYELFTLHSKMLTTNAEFNGYISVIYRNRILHSKLEILATN